MKELSWANVIQVGVHLCVGIFVGELRLDVVWRKPTAGGCTTR